MNIQHTTGNEFGAIDIVAIRGAEIIRRMASQCGVICVYAHSQGTMSFFKALELLPEPDIRKKIYCQGGGGEKFISATALGLGGAGNFWNGIDIVPATNFLPTPEKIQEIPFQIMPTVGIDFGYGSGISVPPDVVKES